MVTEDLKKIIATGRDHYLLLLEESTDLLRNLDRYDPEAMGEAIQRRQDLVEVLQCLDARLGDASAEADHELVKFREFQAEITGKILDLDGLLIGLVRDKQAAVKDKLASLSKTLTASRAYENEGAGRRFRVNESV